jgi:hypothetical protein
VVDTVKFYLFLKDYKIDYETLKDSLDKYDIIIGSNGVERISGILRNIKVNERRFVLQVEGSLPKFYQGHNFTPLSRTELIECIGMLSDMLHLPIERMGISRLDISDTVEVSLKPKYYLDCLVRHPYLEREPRGKNGVYFQNKSRHITFYGKVEEYSFKKKLIPEEFRDKNLLRIENSHKRDVTDWFPFLNNITGLYEPKNYIETIEHWVREFDLMEKADTLAGQLDSMTDKMDYHKLLMVEGMIRRGGQVAALRELETLYDFGKYENNKSGKAKLRRHKNQVNQLFENYNQLDPSFRSLKNELVKKVHLHANRNKGLLV